MKTETPTHTHEVGGGGSIQHALVKFDWGPSRVSPYEINKQKYRKNGLIQIITSL